MEIFSDEDLIEILKSDWESSFEGKARLCKDGIFLYANPQFYKLLEITPAELIGKRFQDITPIGDARDKDVQNSQLVVDGLIQSYLLPKQYQFSDAKFVNVIALMSRVPMDTSKPFRFFSLKIVLNDTEESPLKQDNAGSNTQFLSVTEILLNIINKYGKYFIALAV